MFVPRVHSIELRDAVSELLNAGLSDYEISRRTGVGRATVQRWRLRGIPADQLEIPIVIKPESWDQADREAYAYLLGLYLGDGYVGTIGRTHSLVIACDIRYRQVNEQVVATISRFSPRPPSVLRPKGTNGVRITSYWKAWPLFFPQHGPGSKIDRKIELVKWQTEIVDEHPKAFIRGLIHSDGSRCMNTFKMNLKNGPKEYSYPRYFFTNYSTDIQEIFCRSCDQLGIRWSRSNWRNISISHRKSVALLDEFVGPKN
ncbi:MAG: hypothetical protein KDB57_07940 [Solirubrobacterales bacterium]|nr:hypothetical protein [Solirubrobacterales bacterium]